MKKIIIITGLGCFVLCLSIVFVMRAPNPGNKSSLLKGISNSQVVPAIMKTKVGESKVIPLEAALPTNSKVFYKPEDFSNATTDQATMEFYSKLRNWTDLGTVRTTEKNTQQLWLGDRMVFEAKVIQQVRTMSDDGTVVLAAVTEDILQPVAEEKLRNSELRSCIWAVDARGRAKRISPPNTSGAAPLISRDGKQVAFAGAINEGNLLFQATQIFVVDQKSGEYRSFRSSEHLDDYKVFPAEWAEGGKVLKVIEDWGETGGHMVMRQIRLE